MRKWGIFSIFLFVRLLSVFLVQTWFVPDEYWQSLEVAYRFTFGYGYLTWEWTKGIRSYLYPLTIALFYKILQILDLDCAFLLIYGPRVLQALLSAYADLCFYSWSGSRKWAIFTISSSWFWFYTSSRTLINSFECALTTIALSKFPWTGQSSEKPAAFIWFVALLSSIRPTAVITWTPLCVFHLLTSRRPATLLLTKYIPISLFVLSVTVLIDSWAHGSFILTLYNFAKFNILEDVGSWYGSEPWYWYLVIGFPAIIGINFLPFVIATLVILKHRQSHPNEIALLTTIVFSLTVYSFLPHKEFRFILPLLPIALLITSRFLAVWSIKANKLVLWLVAFVILLGNLVPAFYLGFIHQRGTMDVMEPLRNASHHGNASILFLMPCHSTPLYSHLHSNVSTRFLTCLPNFHQISGYRDEADDFYSNPSFWLLKNYPVNSSFPTHVVCFDALKPYISQFLDKYKTTHEIFHTSFPTARVGRHVLINEIVK